jgi:hypothetical protein
MSVSTARRGCRTRSPVAIGPRCPCTMLWCRVDSDDRHGRSHRSSEPEDSRKMERLAAASYVIVSGDQVSGCIRNKLSPLRRLGSPTDNRRARPSNSEDVAAGRLVSVLSEWMPSEPGLCLYYPGRRNVPAGLRAIIDVIREVGNRPQMISFGA